MFIGDGLWMTLPFIPIHLSENRNVSLTSAAGGLVSLGHL